MVTVKYPNGTWQLRDEDDNVVVEVATTETGEPVVYLFDEDFEVVRGWPGT